MKWVKGGKKGTKKSGKRESQTGVFTVALFHTLFSCPFIFISPRIGCRTPFFPRFSTLFVLLIEKGKKTRAKNEENGEKGTKRA
jgi:hypothetical protein